MFISSKLTSYDANEQITLQGCNYFIGFNVKFLFLFFYKNSVARMW